VKKSPDGSAGADGGYPGRPFGKTDLFFTRLLMNAKLAGQHQGGSQHPAP